LAYGVGEDVKWGWWRWLVWVWGKGEGCKEIRYNIRRSVKGEVEERVQFNCMPGVLQMVVCYGER